MWRLVNEWGYSVVAGSTGGLKIAQMFLIVKGLFRVLFECFTRLPD